MSDSQHQSLKHISRSVVLLNGVHAYAGGEGTPIVLIPGWPQTADAYFEIFPSLSKNHEVWVLDPPGLGTSAPSSTGYDTQNISRLLSQAIDTVLSQPYHLIGHDVGAWIAYAWAAQFPNRIKSLTVLDSAIPGLAPKASFPLPDEVNLKMWQFSFNRLPDLPEILTKGKEKELLDWLFDHKATHPKRITETKRKLYAEAYSRDGAMSQGFAYYRAVTVSAGQNIEFSENEKLKMPILTMGGDGAVGGALKSTMDALAEDISGEVIKDCGHFIMEEQPEIVSKFLLEFLEKVELRKSPIAV
jgi:pimeloyl-ACP methyl ester carboxylesterase